MQHRPLRSDGNLDLQSIINDSAVALLMLDHNSCIRAFTPAVEAAFGVGADDIGRHVADLEAFSTDASLCCDVKAVSESQSSVSREIEGNDGRCYRRDAVAHADGVVVSYADITSYRRALDASQQALERAEIAAESKSRFLALAGHDLRQPLQTLTFVHSALARRVDGEIAKQLVGRLADTTRAMASTLDALHNVNQIDEDDVTATAVNFAVGDMLDKLKSEFLSQAHERGIGLDVVRCRRTAHTDSELLEQIVRQLLASIFKSAGLQRVLLGCRPCGDALRLEIHYLGINVLPKDSAPQKQPNSLSLWLAQRLAHLLGHRVRLINASDRGGSIVIDVPAAQTQSVADPQKSTTISDAALSIDRSQVTANVLVVEERREARERLDVALRANGYRTAMVSNDAEAFRATTQGAVHPDVLVVAHTLPTGLSGVELAQKLSANLQRDIPTVILAPDLSPTENICDIGYALLRNLPGSEELGQLIHQLLSNGDARPASASSAIKARQKHGTVVVIDDDKNVRDALRGLLEDEALSVLTFESSEAFLAAPYPDSEVCLLLDAYLPGMSGLDLLHHLRTSGKRIPVIMVTGSSDVATAVQAMKAGAWDFLTKPVGRSEIVGAVLRTLEQSRDAHKLISWRQNASHHLANLTRRQRQIMDMVLAGRPSKAIAADLGISQRTVENHRAHIMKKTGAKSLPELARVALAASMNEGSELFAHDQRRQG